MSTDVADVFTRRIRYMATISEDDLSSLETIFAEQCAHVFSDRAFMQKLNAVFPEE
ncbi:hypothetical protein [Methanovulcanius yangii]|uniref:hypothetical protein n=1 Tax=Methanovulcanius yangii TaxID=1789227 RepID=UPI0029CA91ED|nr:hypothetical protein [Methanovulcanius yangii]